MKKLTILSCLLMLGLTYPLVAVAQTPIFPTNPSSEDTIVLRVAEPQCKRAPIGGNLHKVEMVQNNITVTFIAWDETIIDFINPSLEISMAELGRLPSGKYTLTTVNSFCSKSKILPYTNQELDKFPFTVTDARLQKKSPWVTLNQSGHWWNPNDSGVGLFIWQDATDNTLVAWFTYTPDGKPAWYVFQPKWVGRTLTDEADLLVASRPPGSNSPPQTATSLAPVGKVRMSFPSPDRAVISYRFGDGQTQRIELVRFKA